MSKKNREDKKTRKAARKETERFFDECHNLPFFARFGIALKLIFGRKINKGDNHE